MNDESLKQLWKEQPMTTATFALDELKLKANRMHRRIALRNSIEYAACAVVIGVFCFYVYQFPHPRMRIGSALSAAAAIFIAWQMKRRASNQALPTAVGEQPWLQFRRSQLVRQRDALRSAWLWYVAPLIPGLVVFRWGVETELSPEGPFARGWVANLFIGLIFLGVAALNRWAAHKLQQGIDQLDRQAS